MWTCAVKKNIWKKEPRYRVTMLYSFRGSYVACTSALHAFLYESIAFPHGDPSEDMTVPFRGGECVKEANLIRYNQSLSVRGRERGGGACAK